MIVSSVIIIAAQPATAAVNYEQEKYDPEEDAMRVRSGGAFKFVTPSMPGYSISQNIEITKITSTFDENILGDRVEFTMTVAGSINNNDDKYKYAFGVLADNDEYIIGYSGGLAVGFELGSGDTFAPLPTVSGNELTLSVLVNDIGNPSSSFDFSGGAVYTREEEYERFLDMAPDKLVLITEPSDMSTVNGQITVKGVVRDSIESRPSGNVRIKIDSGAWDSVSGGTSWSYSLDTTSLSDNQMHTIYVEMEGETLENAQDQIEIFVYQDTTDDSIYKTFNQKPGPTVGSWFKYESIGEAQIIGIPIDVTNEMETRVEAFETVKVDGTNYDTYRLYTHTSGSQHLGYVEYRNDVQRWTWKEDTNFGTPIERTITEGEIIGDPKKTVDSTTTFKPPLETHNYFEVAVGWNDEYRWDFNTNSKSESNTTTSGTTTDNPDLNENLAIAGEALFYRTSMSIAGNTYTNIYAIRTQYENPGVIIIEYYSVDLGVPVQIDTFDPSRNLLFSLGLYDYKIFDTSLVIDEIAIEPSEPKAKSDAKLKIDLKNLGSNSATGYTIEVMNGDQRVGQADVPSITGGSTDTVEVTWKPSAKGTYTLSVNLLLSNDEVDSKPFTVEVGEGTTNGGGDMMFILLLIVVIVIVVVLVLVMMMKKKGAGTGPEAPPEEQPQAPVETAAPAPVAAATQPAAAPATAPAATSAMQQETIQCPSCKNGFTVQYDSKPVKVKCPNCGMEGVLN
jgi:hypothetical protein